MDTMQVHKIRFGWTGRFVCWMDVWDILTSEEDSVFHSIEEVLRRCKEISTNYEKAGLPVPILVVESQVRDVTNKRVYDHKKKRLGPPVDENMKNYLRGVWLPEVKRRAGKFTKE
jgi:hypothetical protein